MGVRDNSDSKGGGHSPSAGVQGASGQSSQEQGLCLGGLV